MKIRIKFTKHGSMKFIGHLDIMRYFQKAIRRAGIDIVYTEGFSPHQIMSFAAPLGVGLESNGEYMDIEVHSIDRDDIESLDRQMAEGIHIAGAWILPENAGNAMASVAAAGYSVRFREGCKPDIDLVGQLDAFYAQPAIPVTKQTKKGEKELDLKPSVYKLETDGTVITMTVDASSAGNIKPGLVMEAFYRFCSLGPLPEFALCVTREETYAAGLVPLSEAGEAV